MKKMLCGFVMLISIVSFSALADARDTGGASSGGQGGGSDGRSVLDALPCLEMVWQEEAPKGRSGAVRVKHRAESECQLDAGRASCVAVVFADGGIPEQAIPFCPQ